MKLDDLNLFNRECAARRPVAFVTDLASGTSRAVRAAEAASDPLAEALVSAFRSGVSGVVQAEGRDHFITVRLPPVRVVVVGAVHIAQALAQITRLVDLDLTVVDPRTAFAAPERFPNVTLLAEWPDDVLTRLALDAYTAVALLTHDPRIDDQALIAALKADCFYIGALGSRKTHAKRIERMRAAGFGNTDLARIHAPIGLDIGAVTPAEIAVSILGEIIAARGRKPRRATTEQAA